MIQTAYKDTAAKTLIGNPQSREASVKKTCQSLGGKLHSLFFTFGEYDVVIIAELPDNKSAAAMGLTAVSGGALSKYRTTVLMTSAEAVEAMRLAQTANYAPPK
jgi:uncharacterized protein with GYD domain